MEEKQGWERPGYFLHDEIVTVPKYDWYGNYGYAKHESNVYLDKLLGEHKYEFSDNHDLVSGEMKMLRKFPFTLTRNLLFLPRLVKSPSIVEQKLH